MDRFKKWSLLLVALVLTVLVSAEILAEKATDKSNITIRQLEPQTVLYTIYRGGYEGIGKAIGELYALATQKKIWPRGALSCVYLNNPQYISKEHCLTEIRIPVAKEALKQAGTLGEMTDIKELRAMEVAVINKQGMQVNYSALFNELYDGISKMGYRGSDNEWETFAGKAKSMDYMNMKSEIMLPVEKISAKD